jgi:hypothetical protein
MEFQWSASLINRSRVHATHSSPMCRLFMIARNTQWNSGEDEDEDIRGIADRAPGARLHD